MKNAFLTIGLFGLLTSCTTTAGLRYDDHIGLLNGKWRTGCSAPIAQPEDLICADAEAYDTIAVDSETGQGSIQQSGAFGNALISIEVVEEKKRLYIIYTYPSGIVRQGEITKLDENRLEVIFVDSGEITVDFRE